MEETKSYYLYGFHPVDEALSSGREIEKVIFRQGLEGEQFRSLLSRLQQANIPVQFVPSERISKLEKGKKSQGVIAYLSNGKPGKIAFWYTSPKVSKALYDLTPKNGGTVSL